MTCILPPSPLYTFDDGYKFHHRAEEPDFDWKGPTDDPNGNLGCKRFCLFKAIRGNSAGTNEVHLPHFCADVNNNTTEVYDGIIDGTKDVVCKTNAEETTVFAPLKRVSPFLNTPKQKKVEKKKIIKLSCKKLEGIRDPEFYLRRAVLVNNTIKKLQLELREEKRQKKRIRCRTNKSLQTIRELNRESLFTSGVHESYLTTEVYEKITDDMTDILVNNVLNNETDDEIQNAKTET